ERTFPNGLTIPLDDEGKKAVANVVANNAEQGVTWVHSYVNPDRTGTFCVYDGPSPEAIRKVAERNGLPVTRITQVCAQCVRGVGRRPRPLPRKLSMARHENILQTIGNTPLVRLNRLAPAGI